MDVQVLHIDNLQGVKFKEVKLIPGDEKSPFYLDVTYEFENLYGFFELHLPKVCMNPFFQNNQLPNLRRDDCFDSIIPLPSSPKLSPVFIAPSYFNLNSGFGLCLEPVPSKGGKCTDVIYEITTIKEKEQEMSLEDIEKELGHKVKIVSKKKKGE